MLDLLDDLISLFSVSVVVLWGFLLFIVQLSQIFESRGSPQHHVMFRKLLILCCILTILSSLFAYSTQELNDEMAIIVSIAVFYLCDVLAFMLTAFALWYLGESNAITFYKLVKENHNAVPKLFKKIWMCCIMSIQVFYIASILFSLVSNSNVLLWFFYSVFDIIVLIAQCGLGYCIKTLRLPLKNRIRADTINMANINSVSSPTATSNGNETSPNETHSNNSKTTTNKIVNNSEVEIVDAIEQQKRQTKRMGSSKKRSKSNRNRNIISINGQTATVIERAMKEKYRSLLIVKRDLRKFDLIGITIIFTIIVVILNLCDLLGNFYNYFESSNLSDNPIVGNLLFITHFSILFGIIIECTIYLWYFTEISVKDIIVDPQTGLATILSKKPSKNTPKHNSNNTNNNNTNTSNKKDTGLIANGPLQNEIDIISSPQSIKDETKRGAIFQTIQLAAQKVKNSKNKDVKDTTGTHKRSMSNLMDVNETDTNIEHQLKSSKIKTEMNSTNKNNDVKSNITNNSSQSTPNTTTNRHLKQLSINNVPSSNRPSLQALQLSFSNYRSNNTLTSEMSHTYRSAAAMSQLSSQLHAERLWGLPATDAMRSIQEYNNYLASGNSPSISSNNKQNKPNLGNYTRNNITPTIGNERAIPIVKNLESVTFDGKVVNKYGRKQVPRTGPLSKELQDAAWEAEKEKQNNNFDNFNNMNEFEMNANDPNDPNATLKNLSGPRGNVPSKYIFETDNFISLRRNLTFSKGSSIRSDVSDATYDMDTLNPNEMDNENAYGLDSSAAIMQTLKFGNNRNDPVSLIIYEFDNVLATLSNKLDDWQAKFEDYLFNQNSFELFENDIIAADVNSFQFMFGGPERVQNLNKHLTKMLSTATTNTRNKNDNDNNNNKRDAAYGTAPSARLNPKCFIFSQRRPSHFIIEILKKLEINHYFTTFGYNNNERIELSHVIGVDHSLMRANKHKEHLVLLKLMSHFKREHDNVLYVGYNKDVIDNLTGISACNTYQIKTKGMRDLDMNKIESQYVKTISYV